MSNRDIEKRRITARDYQRRWRAKNPDLDRAKRYAYRKIRRGRVGMLLTDYHTLRSAQAGACAACREPERTSIALVIDHDHKTGKVRGLLCRRCNLLAQDPERVRIVLQYMERA